MNKTLPSLSDIHTVVFDFDGVFTNNKVIVDQDGKESVVCDRADGLAFDIVRTFQGAGKIKSEFFILSKETNPVVLARAKKMKLECHHGIKDKLAYINQYIQARFTDNTDPLNGLIYIGNDLNDVPLMRCAGYSIAPADAHPMVKEIAYLVMPQNGGDGFVRAFIEKLLGIDKLSEEELDELISHS